MTARDEADPAHKSEAGSSDQIQACLGIDAQALQRLVGDLQQRRPIVYWSDFLLSLAIGYGAFALLPVHDPLSPAGVVLYLLSVLGCYRAIIFTHELAHKPASELRTFRLAWDVLCGIPLLLPSYFYEQHGFHHAARTYGTSRDGEYLSYPRLPLWRTLSFLGMSPFVLPALALRFSILTPLALASPKLRTLILTHASSLVIDTDFRRTVAGKPMPKRWLSQERACFAWCALIAAGFAAGVIGIERLVEASAVVAGVFGLNALRTLLAHKYAGDRQAMAFHRQVLDSNDYSGLLAALWAPVGLRFHAVHHLLPNLPYHALGTAHRRIMAAVPPDSPFRACQYRSLFGGLRATLAVRRRFS